MQHQECFYNCDPVVERFAVGEDVQIYRLPVCASYCDEWFDACKDDYTCAVNWVVRFFIYIETGQNVCPPNHTCRTFAEVYGNGKGLCNNMFGITFIYSEDKDNCTVLNFPTNLPNPNLLLSFPVAREKNICEIDDTIEERKFD